MATIRARCADCGDVELTTADVQVRICSDTNAGTYGFQCPTCLLMVVKPAESRTLDLLVASGVSCSMWSLPAELGERHEGDPICHDDLLDFHDLLNDDDRLSMAIAGIADRWSG